MGHNLRVRSDYHYMEKSQMRGLSLKPFGPRMKQLLDTAKTGTVASVPAKHPSQRFDREVPLKGNIKG